MASWVEILGLVFGFVASTYIALQIWGGCYPNGKVRTLLHPPSTSDSRRNQLLKEQSDILKRIEDKLQAVISGAGS